MKELVELLKVQNLTIGSCESLTAGLFTSKMAEVTGASQVLKGGIVTYQTACKKEVVHIEDQLLDTYGVVSEQCAKEMAQKAQKILDVDICVSFTGNAGPDALEEKPVGLVYCGLAIHNQIFCYSFQLEGTRNEIRNILVLHMCEKIKEQLKNK